MQNLLNENSLILMEGAIIEPLKRTDTITLHPPLVNTPLIYDKKRKD